MCVKIIFLVSKKPVSFTLDEDLFNKVKVLQSRIEKEIGKKLSISELLNALTEKGIKRIESTYAFSQPIHDIDKDLVHVIIETSLLKIGVDALEQVSNTLQEKYGCFLGDCYHHPEYLKEALEGIYGNSHDEIINSIVTEISKNTLNEKLSGFITCLQDKNAKS